jgi:Tfp pilus assembly protein PilF
LARRRVLTRSPGAVILATSVAAVTLVALWSIAEPLRSRDSYSAASAAAIHGDARAALTDARSAANEDPFTLDPLFLLSRLYSDLGQPAAARRELREAVSRQPANPDTWSQLGCYDLAHRRATAAAGELHQALMLEPNQAEIQSNPAGFCASLGA